MKCAFALLGVDEEPDPCLLPLPRSSHRPSLTYEARDILLLFSLYPRHGWILFPSLRSMIGPNSFFFNVIWWFLANMVRQHLQTALISIMGEAVRALDNPFLEQHAP